MGHPREQIGRGKRWVSFKAAVVRFVKRRTRKAERREAKKLVEDSPKKRWYKGWLA